MDFSSSLVIVTGSSRGLGKELSLKFLQEGASVVGISRSSTIEHKNYRHLSADLSDLRSIQEIDFEFKESYSNLILINNAASLGAVLPFEKVNEKEIIDTVNLNFTTPLLLTNKFLSIPCNDDIQKYVLNIGTGAAKNAIDGWSLYCSTKAGLEMFARVLFEEANLNRANCKVLDIAPGIIDTQMQSEIRKSNSSDFSGVELFQDYHVNGELQSADNTAERIIRNFNILFGQNLPTDSIRNHT